MATATEDWPSLDALKPAEFLDAMKTDWNGVYLLGSLNRRITVHSQQCRAINLIQALENPGGGLTGKHLAIVGAGFAGLTAAAYALEKTNADITLFDAAPRPLWLQDSCRNRWLHPGIYDWPLPGSLEPRTNLPVLNWHAGSARNVARQVRSEWDRIAATKAALKLLLERQVVDIKADTGPNGANPRVVIADGSEAAFDIVILAVGFGVEKYDPKQIGNPDQEDDPKHIGYWNDADGLDGIAPDARILISGYGDGGLADVLRLSYPQLQQANLVELVRDVSDEVCRELIEKESKYQSDPAKLDAYYRLLRVEQVIDRLKNSKPMARVALSVHGHLYGTGSAILNRFLVSQLRQARGDDAFRIMPKVISEKEQPDGSTLVTFAGNTEEPFDHVVHRWGPTEAYKKLGLLKEWKAGDLQRKYWRDLPQSLDRTRIPLDPKLRADHAPLGIPANLLAYESSARCWCLILRPTAVKTNWYYEMKLALESCRDVASVNTQSIEIPCDKLFTDKSPLASVVRALCTANIVLADITGYDPTILLLLGMRAAVRRGITIACTSESHSEEYWQNLPFNLRELNVIPSANKDDRLKATLRAALMQSDTSMRYLDLPVYEYVRQEPARDVTSSVQRVLLLHAFKQYDDTRKKVVKARIREGFELSHTDLVESVVDQQSPRLAGQRLYEAIRHWPRCVVDLTWWRPNVLFELGVRLATRASGTYCLLDEKADDDTKGSQALKDLLQPFRYTMDTDSFAPAFASAGASLRVVYDTAARHFQISQDGFEEQADEVLIAGAQAVQGAGYTPEDVDIRPLYGRDSAPLGGAIRDSALEKLCAAWCYLAERAQPQHLRPIDLLDEESEQLFRRFFELGAGLKVPLKLRHGARDARLQQSIADAENHAAKSGTAEMAELLAAWRTVRKTPPWLIDAGKVTPRQVSRWRGTVQQLSVLESRLAAMNNPAARLTLQGVRSDHRRLTRVIERHKEKAK